MLKSFCACLLDPLELAMAVTIAAKTPEGNQISCRLVQVPDRCPICGKHGEPTFIYASILADLAGKPASAVFRCPVSACRRIYVAEYRYNGTTVGAAQNMELVRSILARAAERREFPKNIEDISPLFCNTYNQALIAELNGLDQICGPGYRKALEFLVKDYLVKYVYEADDAKKAQVLKGFLGPVIETHIDEERIKRCAKRAAWLGNDETHYTRKWEDKDIGDLKSLIVMTVNFIDLTIESDRYLEEMP
jgi:hypothetical protein